MTTNDDYFWIEDLGDFIFVIVCDGAGYKEGIFSIGQIAANIIVDYVRRLVPKGPTIKEIASKLSEAVIAASSAFRTLNAVDVKYKDVYCSMACMVISKLSNEVAYASIGNTEIQLYRNGRFSRMNSLQTEAHQLLDQGKIDELDYYVQVNRNILTSALGHFDDITFDAFSGKLQDEDIVLIATDGLFAYRTPDVITTWLAAGNTVHEAVDNVFNNLKEEETPDNTTLMCIFMI